MDKIREIIMFQPAIDIPKSIQLTFLQEITGDSFIILKRSSVLNFFVSISSLQEEGLRIKFCSINI